MTEQIEVMREEYQKKIDQLIAENGNNNNEPPKEEEKPDEPLVGQTVSPAETIVPISLLKTLSNTTQNTVKQRNVSKIIVLFDDGSYQEL